MADAQSERGKPAGERLTPDAVLGIMPAIVPASPEPASPRNSTAHALLLYGTVFVVAAASRLLVASLFFGSVDIVNDTVDSARILDGNLFSARVPYLPGIHLLLWIGGQLAARTGFPVALCFKLFPCLFDSLIAVMIALWSPDRTRALRLGFLYAFVPVPVIVVALHGQWDSIFLYFLILSVFLLRLDTRRGDFLAGVAFVLSVIVKPVAAPLLPFLFPAPWLLFGRRGDRSVRTRTVTLIVAMGTTTAAYLLLLAAMHAPLGRAEIHYIVSYAQHGVQLMGCRLFSDLGYSRSIGLFSYVVLLPAYWWGRLSREQTILLFFAFVLGVCGSAPQYLSWIVPFAFVCEEIAFAALYNLLCGIVLLLYYQTPGTDGRNIENLATYAPLRGLAGLAPSMTNLSEKYLLVFYGGDVIVPLAVIAFFIVAMFRIARSMRSPVAQSQPVTPIQRRAAAIAFLVVALLLGGFCVWAGQQPPITGGELTTRIRAHIDAEYWCVRYREVNPLNPEAPVWVLPSFVDHAIVARPVNVFTIGVGWVLVWTAAATGMVMRTTRSR